LFKREFRLVSLRQLLSREIVRGQGLQLLRGCSKLEPGTGFRFLQGLFNGDDLRLGVALGVVDLPDKGRRGLVQVDPDIV